MKNLIAPLLLAFGINGIQPAFSDPAYTPADLYNAIYRRDLATIRAIEKSGMDIHHALLPQEQKTPLTYATQYKRLIPSLKTLISLNVQLDVQTGFVWDNRSCYYTALHLAAHIENTDAAQTLIAAGANLNLQDRNGRTPLMVSIEESSGLGDVATQLILAGANTELTDREGRTALMYAVRQNYFPNPKAASLVRLLIAKTMNLQARDKDGFTAFDLAVARGDAEMARLIQAAEGVSPVSSTIRNNPVAANGGTSCTIDRGTPRCSGYLFPHLKAFLQSGFQNPVSVAIDHTNSSMCVLDDRGLVCADRDGNPEIYPHFKNPLEVVFHDISNSIPQPCVLDDDGARCLFWSWKRPSDPYGLRLALPGLRLLSQSWDSWYDRGVLCGLNPQETKIYCHELKMDELQVKVPPAELLPLQKPRLMRIRHQMLGSTICIVDDEAMKCWNTRLFEKTDVLVVPSLKNTSDVVFDADDDAVCANDTPTSEKCWRLLRGKWIPLM